MRRVVVTGLGAVTPLGVGTRQTWSRIVAGESGIRSAAHLEPREDWEGISSKVAGMVPSGTSPGQWDPSDWLDATAQRRMPKATQYAVAAAEMALRDARWKPTEAKDLRRTGVYLGIGINGVDDWYTASLTHVCDRRKRLSPLFIPRILPNLAAGHISMAHGFRGDINTVMAACASGARSIGDASVAVASGRQDVILAGGAESCIHPLAFAGFGTLRSLSTAFNDRPELSCRPFDRYRDGFVIAEGAAAVVLEELNHATARGATVLAELRGYGTSSDAYHMTAPREDGSGSLEAMQEALRYARVKPREVDYISAHATGTPIGDAAEVAAIRLLMMGEGGVTTERDITVSSTKGATGHLLGAAGAIEAVFSVLAINDKVVPPTMNLDAPNVTADFNFVPRHAQKKDVNVVLSNSFGFGGTNVSLVFSALGERRS